MKKNKLNGINSYMGIDTLQFKSKHDVEIDTDLYSFIHSEREKHNEYTYYVVNPDKANNDIGIYNSTDYYRTLDYILDTLKIIGLDDVIKSRIDFRFDSFDDNYNSLMKLNKVLLLLIVVKYKVKSKYKSQDLLTEEELTMRIQNKYIEVENYNKALQEPEGEVKNRLELRSKALTADISENTKEYKEFDKWCARLDKVVTTNNFNTLISKTNNALVKRYKEWIEQDGCTLSNFIVCRKDCFYTKQQLEEFLMLIGVKDYVQSAKYYKRKYKIEFFSLKDIELYKNKIIESGARFFDNKKCAFDTLFESNENAYQWLNYEKKCAFHKIEMS